MNNKRLHTELNVIDDITTSVLKVYQKVNPSYVDNFQSSEYKKKYIKRWIDLIVKKLLVPPLCFENAKILDAGCGTGEKSLVYAILGGTVLGIDVNQKAILKALENTKKNKTNKILEFRTGNLLNLDINEEFDIIISDGVIHHTAKPKTAFRNIACRLKPGGIIIIGLPEPCAFFQRRLQKYFINRIADKHDEEQKVKIASILYKKQLLRASSVSGRSVESTIYDHFINPQIELIPLDEVELWMNENNIHMDCTWPRTFLPLTADSQYHPEFESNHITVKKWRNLTRIFWLLKEKYDREMFESWEKCNVNIDIFVNNISSICSETSIDIHRIRKLIDSNERVNTFPLTGYNIQKDMKIFFEELISIDTDISSKKEIGMEPKEIAESITFNRLFKGFSGVGMVYYRGTKKY